MLQREQSFVAVVAWMLSAKGTKDMYINRTENPARLSARDTRATVKKDDQHSESEGLIIERVFGHDAVELAPSLDDKRRERAPKRQPKTQEQALDIKA